VTGELKHIGNFANPKKTFCSVLTNARVAANILNQQSRKADKEWPPAWGLGEDANKSSQ
jgi:hypothetical protein